MGLQESRGKLGSSIRDLMNLWANTKLTWNDVNSERFEETFLRPLELDLRNAAGAMDQMAALLSQLKRDCE
jgi:hypothetical protein